MNFENLGQSEFWGVLIAVCITLVTMMTSFLVAVGKKDSLFTDSIDKLSGAIDRLSDTDHDMKSEIISVGHKVDEVHETVHEISEVVSNHEGRIVTLESKDTRQKSVNHR